MRILKLALLAALTWSTAVCDAQTRTDTAVTRLAGAERWKTDFSRRAVPLHEIVSGGPPRDGIPPIDRPRFETVRAGNRWLTDRDPVMVVEHGGQVRAYPLAILIWHEIVNDVVGGLPVAVTFCPLCNTALVFDRRAAGRLLDFGTTGRLRHSDLVMYDRQTETWWQQATGQAIVGTLVGTRLRAVPQTTMAWKTARETHPGLRVLSRETGHDRPYGRNPYVGYDDRASSPMARFFNRDTDPRLAAMERVVAVDAGAGWAVSFEHLARERVVNATMEGTPFVVLWQPGAASALDRGKVAEGRDVGQTAVYDRRLGGRTLTFRAVSGGFEDRETRSRWDLAGRAVGGPLKGRRLRAVPHGNHFWFAWVVFRPETRLWEP
ncbi:MAG TPA: DUF3179 domain-containing protein [Longimicrobiaceae bacterium]|nr:DUF3179 domain-containing protein [Longimicrobiaceae bacterium]